jgi:hypothetical protein
VNKLFEQAWASRVQMPGEVASVIGLQLGPNKREHSKIIAFSA